MIWIRETLWTVVIIAWRPFNYCCAWKLGGLVNQIARYTPFTVEQIPSKYNLTPRKPRISTNHPSIRVLRGMHAEIWQWQSLEVLRGGLRLSQSGCGKEGGEGEGAWRGMTCQVGVGGGWISYLTSFFPVVWPACVACCLVLVQVVDGKVLCVHGGLSPALSSLDQIQVLERVQEIPHQGPYCDLMWSDPEDIGGEWLCDMCVCVCTGVGWGLDGLIMWYGMIWYGMVWYGG